MKVFLAVTSLHSSYGGPAVSVSRLARALVAAGVEVALWAADQSVASTPLLPAGSPVRRLVGTELEALEHFGRPDLLHDNGIWLSHNHRLASITTRRKIPRIVSTRGMLEPWAIRHKRWKKKIAWWLYQRSDLKTARCHHVTADTEARNVERLGLGVPLSIIGNGVDVPDLNSSIKKMKSENGSKTALYIGRIHPKKGLPMLVEAWARVGPNGWILQIAGPDEAGHRIQVEHAVSAAGLSNVIHFLGPIEGSHKTKTLFNADLVVLPTYSENFGIVVAEALAHGVPVLTTTGTPWSRLTERGCGWWVDPTVDSITRALHEATSLDSWTLEDMGRRGHQWVRAEFGWEKIAKQFLVTYDEFLSHRAMQ